jgi:DNA-binding MarR family transcriptional regulator
MTEDEVRTFRKQLLRLGRRVRREPRPIRGLSGTAIRVLAAITRLGPDAQPGQVAEELQMTSSNVAAALRELRQGEYVTRERVETDARRVRLVLTGAGEELVAHIRAERDSWLGRAVDGLLDEDEQQLLARAGALMQRLAEFEPVGA